MPKLQVMENLETHQSNGTNMMRVMKKHIRFEKID